MIELDALEEIVKARKPKGLDNWKKFEQLSEKLSGKHSAHIAFTTSYPGQEGSVKYLGSSSGNIHFLLGYVNPAFHVAPYHWQLVDPNMSDEEAAKKKHPANPRYWKDSGLPLEDEGDFDEGEAHPYAQSDRHSKARSAAKRSDAIPVQSGYGSYIAAPSKGLVYSLTNGHAYDWRIVRESYFASTNEDVASKMDDEYDEGPGEVEKSVYSKLAEPVNPYDTDVYPLVKSLFPVPGSVIPMEPGTYAVFKSNRIEFFDSKYNEILVKVYDRVYHEFDLTKGGDIHPSILLNFAEKYLNIQTDELAQFVHEVE